MSCLETSFLAMKNSQVLVPPWIDSLMAQSIWSIDGSLLWESTVDLILFVWMLCIFGFPGWTATGTSGSKPTSSCIFRLNVMYLLVGWLNFSLSELHGSSGLQDFEVSFGRTLGTWGFLAFESVGSVDKCIGWMSQVLGPWDLKEGMIVPSFTSTLRCSGDHAMITLGVEPSLILRIPWSTRSCTLCIKAWQSSSEWPGLPKWNSHCEINPFSNNLG